MDTTQLPSIPNFPELEHKWLAFWEKENIVQQYLHKNDSSDKRFSFIDGPITANNPMGVHHGWGRTYKDMWQRFFNLKGFKQRFQNGFDCQGLWVEVEVEKELKLRNKKDIENLVPGDKKASIAKFVQLCKERVQKYATIQTDQSKRLGYFMDWDNSYFTMSNENNYMIWHFLKVCHSKGWIYKGKDSVPWCPRCETAISQHEMLTEDYKEITHETVFFKLPITSEGWENTYLLVWTTTPWTIPANVAVGVNTALTYGVWKDENSPDKYVFLYSAEEGVQPKRQDKKAELSLEAWIMKNSEKTLTHTGKNIKGDKLVGLTYSAPFDHLPRVQKAQREHPPTFHTVVDGSDIVVSTEGTGLLHVAPGAGQEDFKLGKKENLSVISVIADNADYLEGMNEFSGKNAKKHPELIIDFLKTHEKGKYLFKTLHHAHRYPACWRCKAELVWKVALEWYISMDTPDPHDDSHKRTFRQQMQDVAKTINWIPNFGLERELDWLNNMHDWLISKKNRYWGLALPIYECEKCGNFEVLGSRDELKKRAVKGWSEFEGHTPHKPYIDAVKIKCVNCEAVISRLNDVGNVWLDAGIVPFSTLIDPQTTNLSYTTDKTYWRNWFPASFITESFPGQFKNWFYALIAMATALEKTAPFKTVLGYSSVLAEDGRAMHKSWGNAIEFLEGADKMGVDVMRWLYVKQDPTKNLLFGYKKAQEEKRLFHIPLWNSVKFFLTYKELDNWNETSAPNENELSVLDRWILARLSQTVNDTQKNLEQFNGEKAALSIENFVTDLSTWYIRLSRNRTWNNSSNTGDKNAFYSTLYFVLRTLSIILSPILPFFAEELYHLLEAGKQSVHLESWPTITLDQKDQALLNDMALLRTQTEVAHAARKALQIKVRQPLASLIAVLPAETRFALKENIPAYGILLSQEINVKKVEFAEGEEKMPSATFDTLLTVELEEEGRVREYMRTIQQQRKTLGCELTEKVKVVMPKVSEKVLELIKRAVLADEIELSDKDEIVVARK